MVQPGRLSPSGPQYYHTWLTLPMNREVAADAEPGPLPMFAGSTSLMSSIVTGDTPLRVSGLILSILPATPGNGILKLNLYAGNPQALVYESAPVNISTGPLNGLFVPFGGEIRLKPGDNLEPLVEVVQSPGVDVQVFCALSLEYFR